MKRNHLYDFAAGLACGLLALAAIFLYCLFE